MLAGHVTVCYDDSMQFTEEGVFHASSYVLRVLLLLTRLTKEQGVRRRGKDALLSLDDMDAGWTSSSRGRGASTASRACVLLNCS